MRNFGRLEIFEELKECIFEGIFQVSVYVNRNIWEQNLVCGFFSYIDIYFDWVLKKNLFIIFIF